MIILYSNFGALEPDVVIPKSQALLDKALALDPDDADIHASLGLLASTRWDVTAAPADLAAAEQAFERAIALNANHAQAVAWYAGQELFTGEYAHAIELFERSLQLDPLARDLAAQPRRELCRDRRASQGARHLARKRADESGLADGTGGDRPASRGPRPAR